VRSAPGTAVVVQNSVAARPAAMYCAAQRVVTESSDAMVSHALSSVVNEPARHTPFNSHTTDSRVRRCHSGRRSLARQTPVRGLCRWTSRRPRPSRWAYPPNASEPRATTRPATRACSPSRSTFSGFNIPMDDPLLTSVRERCRDVMRSNGRSVRAPWRASISPRTWVNRRVAVKLIGGVDPPTQPRLRRSEWSRAWTATPVTSRQDFGSASPSHTTVAHIRSSRRARGRNGAQMNGALRYGAWPPDTEDWRQWGDRLVGRTRGCGRGSVATPHPLVSQRRDRCPGGRATRANPAKAGDAKLRGYRPR